MDSMQMDYTSAINIEEYNAVFRRSNDGGFLVPDYYSLTHLKFFDKSFSNVINQDGFTIESQSILLDALPIIPISELCKSENVNNASPNFILAGLITHAINPTTIQNPFDGLNVEFNINLFSVTAGKLNLADINKFNSGISNINADFDNLTFSLNYDQQKYELLGLIKKTDLESRIDGSIQMDVNEFIEEYIIPLDELGEVMLAFNKVYHNPTIRNIDNFIELGGDPNQKHSNDRGLLHRLVRVGSLREIEHFLDIDGIDVNIKVPFDWPLVHNHAAVRHARENDPDSLFSTPLDDVYAYYQALKTSEDEQLSEDERDRAAKRLSAYRRYGGGAIAGEVNRTEIQLLEIAELLLSKGGKFMRFDGDQGALQFESIVNNPYDPDDPTEKFKIEVLKGLGEGLGEGQGWGESSIDEIKDLIENDRVDVNTTIDPSGNTALHYTILNVPPNLELAQTLIHELEADIDATNNDGKTALDLAWELYKENYNFEDGTTLSDFEALYNNNSLSAIENEQQRDFLQAILNAHQIIKLLVLSEPNSLPEGLDEDWFISESNFDDEDLDLLLIDEVNALISDTNRIRELIDEGADPNAKTPATVGMSGSLPPMPVLYTAVLRGKHEVVKALIDKGADPLSSHSLTLHEENSGETIGQMDISLLELINMQFNSRLNTDPNEYKIQEEDENDDQYDQEINYYNNLRKSVNHLLCAVDNENIPDGLFLQCGDAETGPTYIPPQQENSQELFELLIEMSSSDDTIEELTDSQVDQIRDLINRDPNILTATQDGTGLTALHLAIMTANERLVNLLLEYDFDLNQMVESGNPAFETYNGMTALEIGVDMLEIRNTADNDGDGSQDKLQYYRNTINKLERIINSLVCSGATLPDKSNLFCVASDDVPEMTGVDEARGRE